MTPFVLFGPNIAKLKARKNVHKLSKVLMSSRIRSLIRSEAADAIREIGGSAALESLCAALKADDWDVQRRVVSLLQSIGDRKAVIPLARALADPQFCAKRETGEALQKLADRSAVELIVELLKTGDEEARRIAAGVLGQIGDPRARNPLSHALTDSSFSVRGAAASALARVGVEGIVPDLVHALRDTKKSLDALWGCRRGLSPDFHEGSAALGALIQTLSKSRDATAVQPIVEMLTVAYVHNAEEALVAIGDPAVPVLIQAVGEVHDGAMRAIAAIGKARRATSEDSVDSLIRAVQDKTNAMRRYCAAQIVGQLKLKKAVPSLIGILSDRSVGWVESVESPPDPDFHPPTHLPRTVGGEAARALGRIGDPSAIPALVQVLKHIEGIPQDKQLSGLPFTISTSNEELCENVRQGAAEALGYFREPAAASCLVQLLRSGHGIWGLLGYKAVWSLEKIAGRKFHNAPQEAIRWWEEEGKAILNN